MLPRIAAFLGAPLRWFRNLYDWTTHWARTGYATAALFGIAFAESSFFPIPPDVLLIAMGIANPRRWWFFALVCTAGSLCGAYLGYFIGWGLYASVGQWIVETYHIADVVAVIERKYAENAFITIFTAAFTPIPYKAITITAGLFEIPLMTLTVASIIGRGGRFFLVAGALRVFGDRIADSIEKYFDIFSITFVVLLIGGMVALKYFSK